MSNSWNDRNVSPIIKHSLSLPVMILMDTSVHSYALIAGGSRGIGYGIAQAFAKRGYRLIIIARNMENLLTAKQNLETDYAIEVQTLSKDLSKPESDDEIAHWCMENKIALKALCNVAGIGGVKDYLSLPLETIRYMLQLNLTSAVGLTANLLPILEANAPAYILNVASMAGLAPIPSKNIYSTTKVGILFFSYSLRYQLKDKHISVSALAPGPVYTKEDVIKATEKALGKYGDLMALTPHRIGEVAVRETLRKKMVIVPGFLAHINSWIIRLLPNRWMASLYYHMQSGK